MGRFPDESASFAGVFEFAVAFGVDGVASSGEDVVGCDVADGAVQADGVVMEDEVADDAIGIGL